MIFLLSLFLIYVSFSFCNRNNFPCTKELTQKNLLSDINDQKRLNQPTQLIKFLEQVVEKLSPSIDSKSVGMHLLSQCKSNFVHARQVGSDMREIPYQMILSNKKDGLALRMRRYIITTANHQPTCTISYTKTMSLDRQTFEQQHNNQFEAYISFMRIEACKITGNILIEGIKKTGNPSKECADLEILELHIGHQTSTLEPQLLGSPVYLIIGCPYKVIKDLHGFLSTSNGQAKEVERLH